MMVDGRQAELFVPRLKGEEFGGAPRCCKNRYANSQRVSPLGSGRLRF